MQLSEKRKKAVQLDKEGINSAEIAETVGVHKSTVTRWISEFKKHGTEGLAPKTRGRKKGSLALSANEELRLKRLIEGEMTRHSRLTHTEIQCLAKEKLGISVSVRTIGNYMTQWGQVIKAASNDSGIIVRMPAALHEELKDYAKKGERSLNAEIVRRLSRYNVIERELQEERSLMISLLARIMILDLSKVTNEDKEDLYHRYHPCER